MEGKRFIQRLKIRNLLSYESAELDLQPLNVLIGPNASGKSNLIETIGLLSALPLDLTSPIREGGGVGEWLWKGSPKTPIAEVEALVNYPEGKMPLRYQLQFTMQGQRLEIVDEAIENQHPTNSWEQDVFFFYRYQKGNPTLNIRTTRDAQAGESDGRDRRYLRREDLKPDQSVLSQRKDPDLYPELTYLGNQFSAIRLYREWNLGRYTPPRMPQKPDLPEDFLLEDASNLGLVLANLQYRLEPGALVEQLQKFYEPVKEIQARISGGTVQLLALLNSGMNQVGTGTSPNLR